MPLRLTSSRERSTRGRARAVIALCLGAAGLAMECAAAPAVPDTMAQRALACTGCHGSEGRSTPQGYVPRIAGKPVQYLQQQLAAFRDGRRPHEGMARLLAHVDDAYLQALAEHFALLQVPYAPPAPVRPVDQPLLARGEALARAGDEAQAVPGCVQCHGAGLTGVAPAVPALVGLPRDYLMAQLGAWRQGLRRARAPDCMATIARRLMPQDVTAVSAWLASQPVPAPAQAASAPPGDWPMDCGSVPP